MLSSGKFARFALAIACLLSALLVFVVLGAGAGANSQLVSDLLQTAIAAWAAVSSFLATRRSSGYLRRLWRLFTVSLILVVCAQVIESYYENLAHTPFAKPWLSDIVFLLWVIPALIMLLPRPVEELGGIAWETILDFAQLGIVALTAYLYFFYLTSRWGAQGPQMVLKEIWLQMYRDLALAAAFLIRRQTTRSKPVKALFGRVSLFFLLTAGGSLSYLLSWPVRTARANWYDVAWCLPYLFVTAFASPWKMKEATAEEKSSPGSAAIFTRVLPVGMPLLVLLMSWRIAHEQATLAWGAITASFFVSTARLVLSNEKQLRVADNLRRAEAALQQSAKMFATAFQSGLDAISISLIPEGRFLAVNDSFLRITGYAREEVLGKSAGDLKLWVNDEQRAGFFVKMQMGAEVKEEEFLLKTKAGDIRMVQLSAARVQLEGRPAILGMARDVTDRRRAEEALRVSEARFRTLVQDLHVGIVLLGREAETLFANRAALGIFGLADEQVLGRASSCFEMTAIREDGTEMPFPDRPGPRAIALKRPLRGEVVGWRREQSSETFWTLVDAVPHLNQQGEVTNVILSISDITKRKKAEEELRDSEERFRTLVDSFHVGVVLLGPKAEILFANPAALKIFRLSLEQVLGKTSEELGLVVLREDGTEMPFAIRPATRAIATGQPVCDAVMGWQRPGSKEILWILGEVVPLFSREGRLERLVAAFSDITQRKETEEALHHLSARLLRLQDEERRRLGRELHDSLAQSVMAVNLDLAQVARSSLPLDKKARHALAEARGVLREMSREIRTLSYLLHPPVLDELGLVSALKEYAQGFSERSGIRLQIDIQPDFPRMPQEVETAFFRIVQESLANIQKHSGSATGKIRLHAKPCLAQLEIGDQGCGIAAMPQADRGNDPKASRLGVGILGMRERMAQLGGTLEVESGSSGTTVRATIPLIVEGTHATPSHSRGG